MKMAYYLTNGYPEDYQMPPDIADDMRFPYGNTCWYTSTEGFGYYVRKQDVSDRIEVYENNMKVGVIAGYFLLFIHLLYQKYTLIYFAERIESSLSADSEDYKLKSDTDDEKRAYSERCVEQLEDIRMDINVFLIKSVNASVSHARYQNEFYDYSERSLGIQDNIKSVTSGLQSLEELQQIRLDRKMQVEEEKRQKENEKMSNAVGLLSILVIISAYADGFATIDAIKNWPVFCLIPEEVLRAGSFAIITCLAFYVVLTLIRSNLKRKKDRK